MTVVLGLAAIMAVQAVIELIRLPRCKSCEPHCPNGHRYRIAGNEGVLLASVVLGIASVIDLLMR